MDSIFLFFGAKKVHPCRRNWHCFPRPPMDSIFFVFWCQKSTPLQKKLALLCKTSYGLYFFLFFGAKKVHLYRRNWHCFARPPMDSIFFCFLVPKKYTFTEEIGIALQDLLWTLFFFVF